MKSQQLMLIISVVIAAAAGFLLYNYLGTASKPTTAVVTRTVLVAAKDIPARAAITQAMLQTVTRSVSDVDRDAVSDPKAAVGFLALTSIPAGASITSSRVGKPDDAPLPVRLKAGMRALTIPIDSVRGVAGMIEPGDHVDVIAVLNRGSVGSSGSGVETALHDVLVLAMGTSLEQQNNPQTTESPNATTVTLAVTPKQAEMLTLADSVAQLRLSLRPPGDKANKIADNFSLAKPQQPERNPFPMQMPVAAAPQAAAAAPATVVQRVVQAAPAPVAAPKAASHELMVTVIDGDHVVGNGK